MKNPKAKERDRDKDRRLEKINAVEMEDLKTLGNDEEDEELRELVKSEDNEWVNTSKEVGFPITQLSCTQEEGSLNFSEGVGPDDSFLEEKANRSKVDLSGLNENKKRSLQEEMA